MPGIPPFSLRASSNASAPLDVLDEAAA